MLLFNFVEDFSSLIDAIRYAMETQKRQPYQNVIAFEDPVSFKKFLYKMGGSENINVGVSELIDTEKILIHETTKRVYIDATSYLFNVFNTTFSYKIMGFILRNTPKESGLFSYENYIGEYGPSSEIGGFHSSPFKIRDVGVKLRTVIEAFTIMMDEMIKQFPKASEFFIIFERNCSFTDPNDSRYVQLSDLDLDLRDVNAVSLWEPSDIEEFIGGGNGKFFEVLFNEESRDRLIDFILHVLVTYVWDNSSNYAGKSFYFDGPSAKYNTPTKDYIPYPLVVSAETGITTFVRKDRNDDIFPSNEQHFMSALATGGNYHFADFVSTSIRAMYRESRLNGKILEDNITVVTEEDNKNVFFSLLYCYQNYPTKTEEISGSARLWLRFEWFNLFNKLKQKYPFNLSGQRWSSIPFEGTWGTSRIWKYEAKKSLLTLDIIHLYEAINASAFKSVQNMDAFVSLFHYVRKRSGFFLPFVGIPMEIDSHQNLYKTLPKYEWSVSLYNALIMNSLPELSPVTNHEGIATVDEHDLGLYNYIFLLSTHGRFYMNDSEIKKEEKKVLGYLNEMWSRRRKRKAREEAEIRLVLLTGYNNFMNAVRKTLLFNPHNIGALLSFVCFIMFFVEMMDKDKHEERFPQSIHIKSINWRGGNISSETLRNLQALFFHMRDQFIPWLGKRITKTPVEENIIDYCFNFSVLLSWMRTIINDPENEKEVLRIIEEAYGYKGFHLQQWDQMLGGTENESGLLFKSRVEERTPNAIMESAAVKNWLKDIPNETLGYNVLKHILNEIVPFLSPNSEKLFNMGMETASNCVRWDIASHNVSWHPMYQLRNRYLVNFTKPNDIWPSMKEYTTKDKRRFAKEMRLSDYEYSSKPIKDVVNLPLKDSELLPIKWWLRKGKEIEGNVTLQYKWFKLKGELSIVSGVSNYFLHKWFPYVSFVTISKKVEWEEIYTHLMTPFLHWTLEIPVIHDEIPSNLTSKAFVSFLREHYEKYNTTYYDEGYLNFIGSYLFTIEGGDIREEVSEYFSTNLLGRSIAPEFVSISKSIFQLIEWANKNGVIIKEDFTSRVNISRRFFDQNDQYLLYNTRAKIYFVLYRIISSILFGGVQFTEIETTEEGIYYPIDHVHATTFRPDPISPMFIDDNSPYISFRLWEIDLPKWTYPPVWAEIVYPFVERKATDPNVCVTCIIGKKEIPKEMKKRWSIPKFSKDAKAIMGIQRDPFCGKWFLVLLWMLEVSEKASVSMLMQTPPSKLYAGKDKVPKNERNMPFTRIALEWEILIREHVIERMKEGKQLWQNYDWYYLWRQYILSRYGWVQWITKKNPIVERYVLLFAIYHSQDKIRWHTDASRNRIMIKTVFGTEEKIDPRLHPAPKGTMTFLPTGFKKFLINKGVYYENVFPSGVERIDMRKDLLDWEFSVFLSSEETILRKSEDMSGTLRDLIRSESIPFLPYAERTRIGVFILNAAENLINYIKIPRLIKELKEITGSKMHITPDGKWSSKLESERVISLTRQPAIFMDMNWYKSERNPGLFGENYNRAPIYEGMWYIVSHNVRKELATIEFPGEIIGIAFQLGTPLFDKLSLYNIISKMDILADPTRESKPISTRIINSIENLNKWVESEKRNPTKKRIYRDGFRRWERMMRKLDE